MNRWPSGHRRSNRLAGSARTHGELHPDTDPEQLAFELHAYCAAAAYQTRLTPSRNGDRRG